MDTDFMTWPEMFLNGVGIGMVRHLILQAVPTWEAAIRPGRHREYIVFCAVAVGTVKPATRGVQVAPVTGPSSPMNFMASAV
jgi:hypothetical protein